MVHCIREQSPSGRKKRGINGRFVKNSASSLEESSSRVVVHQKPWRKGSSKYIKEPFLITYLRVHKVLSLLKNIA